MYDLFQLAGRAGTESREMLDISCTFSPFMYFAWQQINTFFFFMSHKLFKVDIAFFAHKPTLASIKYKSSDYVMLHAYQSFVSFGKCTGWLWSYVYSCVVELCLFICCGVVFIRSCGVFIWSCVYLSCMYYNCSRCVLKPVSDSSALSFSCAGADWGLFENVSAARQPQPTEVKDKCDHCCVLQLFLGGKSYRPFTLVCIVHSLVVKVCCSSNELCVLVANVNKQCQLTLHWACRDQKLFCLLWHS